MYIRESSANIFMCPFCFDYKVSDVKPMSLDDKNSMYEHIDSCPSRRKNRIKNAINKTIDEYYDLLVKLSDSDDE